MTLRTARFGKTLVLVGERGCMTVLPDGKRVPACPHDTDEYRATAERLGYGADTTRMCIEHELAHNWLDHALGMPVSPVMHAVAHGEPDCALHGLAEDAVMALQAYANALGINLLDVLTR